MPSRNSLVTRANAVGIAVANYRNDSKLEAKILYAEKNATAQTGTISTTTLTSNGTAATDGDFLAVGGLTYTAKTALTEVAASSTLTSNNTTMSDGDFVSIDGITYTFRTTLTNGGTAPYEVLINSSADGGLGKLLLAVAASGTAGTDYGVGTLAHPTVTTGSVTSHTLVFTAKTVGTIGNNILTYTKNAGTLSWTGTSLSGGVNSVAGEVLIGSTADGSAFLTNLKAAILNSGTVGTTYATATVAPNPSVTATTLTGTTLLINSRDFYIMNGAQATTTTNAGTLSFTSTVMASGVSKVITPNLTSTTAGSPGISDDFNHI